MATPRLLAEFVAELNHFKMTTEIVSKILEESYDVGQFYCNRETFFSLTQEKAEQIDPPDCEHDCDHEAKEEKVEADNKRKFSEAEDLVKPETESESCVVLLMKN